MIQIRVFDSSTPDVDKVINKFIEDGNALHMKDVSSIKNEERCLVVQFIHKLEFIGSQYVLTYETGLN